MMAKKNSLPDLETTLTHINQLITQMEQGHLTLEDSLKHFERGVTLIKHAQGILKTTEQKIQCLTQENGKETLTHYENPDE